jgi:hypothetical protein
MWEWWLRVAALIGQEGVWSGVTWVWSTSWPRAQIQAQGWEKEGRMVNLVVFSCPTRWSTCCRSSSIWKHQPVRLRGGVSQSSPIDWYHEKCHHRHMCRNFHGVGRGGKCQGLYDWKTRKSRWFISIFRLLSNGGFEVLDAMKILIQRPLCGYGCY